MNLKPQPTLFDTSPPSASNNWGERIGATEPIRFDGPAYEPSRDNERLTGQLLRIFDYMKDGRWRTLFEIAEATGDPQASISAQLRHLRKERFGGHAVNRQYIDNGLHQYQLIVNKEQT